MATARTNRLDRRHTVDLGEPGGDTGDEELLARFLESEPTGSEKAFRELMVRHGPMVMGVCRNVLHNDQDAEDAFQATFLTLARKGDTIRDRRILVGWLYEVAYRIAIRARASAVRRKEQERKSVAMSVTSVHPEHENDAAWNELRPVLHDEVNRLPEKYRLPVILSYLEGKSNEEVARLLDWPVGTVKGRLSRARDLLRSRLTRRGMVLSAAFLCTALSRGELFAETVPTSLIDHTLQAAMRARWEVASAGALADSDAPAEQDLDLFNRWDSPVLSNDLSKTKRAIAKGFPGLGLVIVIAVASLGFAASSLFGGNPSLLAAFKNTINSLPFSTSSSGCH
jgi:RNA polymerase sigma factor (sigma-70 family)